MKRDTVKTLVGLIIIGLIVVATFVYGSAQRQAQLKHDQEVKKQQAAKNDDKNDEPKKAQPSASVKPGATNTSADSKKQTGTAPVQSPAASVIQGSAQSQQVPAPKPSTTPVTGGSGQVAGAETSGDSSAPLPDTGAPVAGLVGFAAIAVMLVALRRSKRAVFAAARSKR
jgi:cobalamin biosynthesis Mg chelatase CobN